VLVPEDSTLAGLHRVIQAAMGWADRHLWRMQIGGVEYSDVTMEGWGERVHAAGAVRLNGVAGPGDVLLYGYDFEDSWEHRIQVEKVSPADSGETSPVCIVAERACPPEDCGGVPGYERLLEVLAQAEARLQRVLSENPEATIDDLNVALQGALSGYNLRPQVARPVPDAAGTATCLYGRARGLTDQLSSQGVSRRRSRRSRLALQFAPEFTVMTVQAPAAPVKSRNG
jgi:hypothetical protein